MKTPNMRTTTTIKTRKPRGVIKRGKGTTAGITSETSAPIATPTPTPTPIASASAMVWSLSPLKQMPKTLRTPLSAALPTTTPPPSAAAAAATPTLSPPPPPQQQLSSYLPFMSSSATCRRGRRHSLRSRLVRWPVAMTNAAIFYLLATTLCVLTPMTQALINCPLGCSCDDVELVVKCSEGTLDVVPITLNPSIQRLIITNNKKIRTFDSSIQFYYDLTYLDLSNNELVNIPADTFKMQSKLRELNLSHNKIGQINNKTFNGLASVTVLNLRGNLLAELERATFATISKVAELNLGANRINSIDPHAFVGLVNLRVLYLDDNTLTTLPTAETFQAMPSLAELFLGTNSFVTLPAAGFSSVKGLTSLDLRSAGLHNISEDSFIGLEGLRALDLSDNRLQQVPTDALAHLPRLEKLRLGQNDFVNILPGAFNGLKNLKHLEITGAQQLERIANGAFAENTNLEQLNFSGNKILSTIEADALRGLPNLRGVILRENQLHTLAEGLFTWADLEVLDLTDNPIVCDCHVLWLRNLLVTSNETNWSDLTSVSSAPHRKIESVICAQPERFRSEPLAQLSPTVLGCASGAPSSQTLLIVLIVSICVILGLLCFLVYYSCRRRIREALKGGWGNSALGRKEREYQKTFSDEEYMTRQRHPCLNLGVHPPLATAPYVNDTLQGNYNSHNPAYMGSRPMPSTEL